MNGDPSDFDPRDLWRNQPTEHDPMTLAAIHDKASAFRSRIRRRNLTEYIGAVVVILGALPLLLIRGSWMMQAGGVAMIAATVFVTWRIHRRASAGAAPEAGEPLVDFYRAELIRQRDAVRSVGAWYLAPFFPAMALVFLGRWFQSHAPRRSLATDHLVIAAGAGVVALVFLAVWLLNQRAAHLLQRRIDEL